MEEIRRFFRTYEMQLLITLAMTVLQNFSYDHQLHRLPRVQEPGGFLLEFQRCPTVKIRLTLPFIVHRVVDSGKTDRSLRRDPHVISDDL
jgi:hypothetical protein